tara:strand:- start:436 stop:1377 length:942 start_codon:yes stop_codon:yes gene_type:complete
MQYKINKQLASNLLMIRPCQFFSNPQTADSNKFQGRSKLSEKELQEAALNEFDALVSKLREADLNVYVFEDTPDPVTPDSVFPNNWVSFHSDGTVVLYPMEAENRRLERRIDVIDALRDQHGFDVKKIIDMSCLEDKQEYLEGTGSMILDHMNKIAYACLSSRTHKNALLDFSKKMGFSPIPFCAKDALDSDVYHTNVIMSLGEKLAVLCEDAIPIDSEKKQVKDSLQSTGHEIITISLDQMASFAGNVLEVISSSNEHLMLMSERAKKSFTKKQKSTIEKYCRIISSPIQNIEDSAGGSVRCMIAEISLPRK